MIWGDLRREARALAKVRAPAAPHSADAPGAHVITDPPYSPKVHTNSKRGGVRGAVAFDREIDFDPMTPALMRASAELLHRWATRWVLVFCDVELAHEWCAELEARELRYVRTCAWVKLGSTPQFSGDRPAAGFEAIAVAHAGTGRMRWNGGGERGVWSFATENNRGGENERLHTTQKPVSLMLHLVDRFTDRGDFVLDPFAGVATTGVACVRLGRHFVGVEKRRDYFEIACERLAAEVTGRTINEARVDASVGQVGLFEGQRTEA